ncbi:hypothetical protein [uncultured Lentibacter sp.]|uniref:hypothetical protein n=1 Tax=uncultured Lentibacter sp. TaxID=1659309 RepID=UPI00260600B5|nr:hypothetical protein [uncultured Lentibacter sp.]
MLALLCLLTLGIMCALAWRTNRHYRAQSRLPMQFDLFGNAGLYAPRALALAFMPALAAIILLPFLLLAPDALGLIIACACLLSGQAFYHWLLARSL